MGSKNTLRWIGCVVLGVGMSGCVISRHSERIENLPEKAAQAPVAPEQDVAKQLAALMAEFGGRLNFDWDSADLKSEAKENLVRIANLLVKHPEQKLRVDGFTDSTGSPGYNEKLSEKRAHAVTGFLAENGVQASQLEAFGHGQSMPLANNATDEGRAENRRVEIKIEQPPVG